MSPDPVDKNTRVPSVTLYPAGIPEKLYRRVSEPSPSPWVEVISTTAEVVSSSTIVLVIPVGTLGVSATP